MSKLSIKDLTPCYGGYKFIQDVDDASWHIVNVTTYVPKCGKEDAFLYMDGSRDPIEEEYICPECLKVMREDSARVDVIDEPEEVH